MCANKTILRYVDMSFVENKVSLQDFLFTIKQTNLDLQHVSTVVILQIKITSPAHYKPAHLSNNH